MTFECGAEPIAIPLSQSLTLSKDTVLDGAAWSASMVAARFASST